ncbi:MAG: dual specificity protein phosphatase family protein [Thermodesulfobacteriota bacterium]
MKTLTKTLTLLLLLLTAATLYAQEPRVRPDTWARPIINTDLKNWHQVDDKVYRSAQPDGDDMKTIAAFGIKEILNLRKLFSDGDEAEGTGLVLHRVKAEADDLTQEQVVEALKIIAGAKGKILVHCWHGADRTGAVIAAYRMAAHGWSAEAAIDEMVNGGFGFHATYDNLISLIRGLDVEQLRRETGLSPDRP